MGYVVKPSPYNPIPFAEKDKVQPDTVGYTHPRKLLPEYDVETGEHVEIFYWPVNNAQTVALQFNIGKVGTDGWNFTVLNFNDADGSYLGFMDGVVVDAGVTDSLGEPLYTILFQFKPNDKAFLSGKTLVYLELKAHFGDGSALAVGDTVYTLTSPVLQLADNHEGCSLIQYSNDTNTLDGTIFTIPEVYPSYQIYVPSGRLKTMPGGEYIVFNDQRDKVTKLHKEPVNKYQFDVINAPVRMLDILNYALPCDNLVVNRDKMVLVEAPDELNGNPQQTVTYILADKDIDNTLELSQDLVPLFSRPAGYNYFVTQMFLVDGVNSIFMLGRVFEDSGDEDDWITAAEVKRVAAGAQGEFFIQDGTFYYLNAPGEKYRPKLFIPEVLPKELVITLNVSNATFPANVALYYPDNALRKVGFKDTSGGGDGLVYDNFTTGLYTNVFKLYGTTGDKTFRIFHNDEEIEYGFVSPGSYPKVTDITGLASSRLNKINCQNGNFSAHTTFDLDFLAPAKYSLKTFIFKNCQLEGFTATWASALVVGSGSTAVKPFPFEYVDIGGNSVSVTNLDAFINEFYSSCAWSAGINKLFRTIGQSPAAPPSTSAANITTLETTYGWDFQTD